MQSTNDFYDMRGDKAFKSGQLPCVNLTFLSPYRFFYQYLDKLPSGACVLEVGVGTGLHLAEVAKRGHICYGVDISESSLRSVKENFKRLNLDKHLTLLHGSFDHLNLQDKNFDLIYTSGALYYLSLAKFLIFLENHLKSKNGSFVCVETNGSNLILNLYRKLKNYIYKHRDQQTLTGLLKPKDIDDFHNFFKEVKIIYFDFLVLITVILADTSFFKKMLISFLKPIDFFILNTLGLNFLAFKFVVVATGLRSN